jgi:hypothetical protein
LNKPLLALAAIVILGTAGVGGVIAVSSAGQEGVAQQLGPASPSDTTTTSMIRITFTKAGKPTTIDLSREISTLSADGIPCLASSVLGPTKSYKYETTWPLSGSSQPEACRKGPPTNLRFEFSPIGSDDQQKKDFVAELVWTGKDTGISIEVPSLITIRFVSNSQPKHVRLTN